MKATRRATASILARFFSRTCLTGNLTDPYGRLLRYVWVGDLLVNAELVRLGYARAVAYPPDTKNQAQFAALQAEAQATRRGLWAHVAPTPAAGHTLVQITGLRRDGAINPNEPDEYVEITNQGTVPQDLTGWRLDSERARRQDRCSASRPAS